MIDTGDVTMFCHWNKRLVCKKDFYCDTCKHQLAADDKENGKAEPVQLRWTEDYDGGRVPECPSCGNMPYSLERCIFCGQRFLPDALTKEWSKRSVWSVSTNGFRGAHFAVFPEKLIEPCILAGCPEGGVVLDPFAGSGTAGVVAKRMGRGFVGCEIVPSYVEMAARRIAEVERNE